MRKSLITALAAVLVLFSYGFGTSRWDHVWYIAGGLGLVCAGNALFIFIDKWILGDKGRFWTNKERSVSRSHEAMQYWIAAVALCIPAMAGLLLK